MTAGDSPAWTTWVGREVTLDCGRSGRVTMARSSVSCDLLFVLTCSGTLIKTSCSHVVAAVERPAARREDTPALRAFIPAQAGERCTCAPTSARPLPRHQSAPDS